MARKLKSCEKTCKQVFRLFFEWQKSLEGKSEGKEESARNCLIHPRITSSKLDFTVRLQYCCKKEAKWNLRVDKTVKKKDCREKITWQSRRKWEDVLDGLCCRRSRSRSLLTDVSQKVMDILGGSRTDSTKTGIVRKKSLEKKKQTFYN